MGNVNTLLTERLKRGGGTSKMATMAEQSAKGQLTSFSGIFGKTELTEQEKVFLETLLHDFAIDVDDISPDLQALVSITSEVKAINNQAVMLHGERIKKAHSILTKYRDGAFTAWLIAAYGNRQTPYNFWQYYEFYEASPKSMRLQIETMPRQAIYTLASREAPLEKKQKFVESYRGETKAELLQRIRDIFPLDTRDRRRQNVGDNAIQTLTKLWKTLQGPNSSLSKKQKNEIEHLLDAIADLLK